MKKNGILEVRQNSSLFMIKRTLQILYIPNGEYIYPPKRFYKFGVSHFYVERYREKQIKKFANLCSFWSTRETRKDFWSSNLPKNHEFLECEFEFMLIETEEPDK